MITISYTQTIYNKLRAAGITQPGALGILGNWDCESNCEPCRVQGDFSYRTLSKDYVRNITNGSLSRDTFIYDQKGFGLAQWTYYSRKADLYDSWKKSGLSIDDVEFQVSFALKEMRQDFPYLFQFLKTCGDIYQACYEVCYKYENPAVKNVDARFRSATRIRYEIDLNWNKPTEPAEDPKPTEPEKPVETPELPSGWEKIPITEYWPPRGYKGGKEDPGLCFGMSGPDIGVIQAILKARGFKVTTITGTFDQELTDAVKAFQDAYNLGADGIVGKNTWRKLFEINV